MSQRYHIPANYQQNSRGARHRSSTRVSIRDIPDGDGDGDWGVTGDVSVEIFDAELKHLYEVPKETIRYISCGGTVQNDPVLLTPDIVTQKRRAQRKKLQRLQQAQRVFKLSAELVAGMQARNTAREEWEKRFSTRHNQRYWRHKATGVTRTLRPYQNPQLSDEGDSTEESEVSVGESEDESGSGSSSSESESESESSSSSSGEEEGASGKTGSRHGSGSRRSSSGSGSGSGSGSRRSSRRSSSGSGSGSGSEADKASSSKSRRSSSNATDATSAPRSRSSVGSRRSDATGASSRRSSNASSGSGSGHGTDESDSGSDEAGAGSGSGSGSGSRTATLLSQAETTAASAGASISVPDTASSASASASASAPASGAGRDEDLGVWEEKLSSKWGIPYWQNQDTRHVVWHCPSATAPGSPLAPQRRTRSPAPSQHQHQHQHQSRYYVTRLISLDTKGKEKEKRDKRREAAQWRMKYSLEYDGFYYKNRQTGKLSWEDPRPALLDQTDYESFIAKRATIRASMRADALAGVAGGGMRGLRASFKAMAVLGEGEEEESEEKEGSDEEKEKESTGDGGRKKKKKGEGVWRVKFSAAYGCNYYKNKINGKIVWEDPRQQ